MSPHGSESMTFSDVATVCIFVTLLWFAATKIQILFQISAIFLFISYNISQNGRFLYKTFATAFSNFVRSIHMLCALFYLLDAVVL